MTFENKKTQKCIEFSKLSDNNNNNIIIIKNKVSFFINAIHYQKTTLKIVWQNIGSSHNVNSREKNVNGFTV